MTNNNLDNLTIKETKEKLLKKEFSAVELTRMYLDRIEEYKSLNSYITIMNERAIERAEEIDSMIQRGDTNYDMLGVPIAMKDLFCTKGTRTTSGSRALQDFVPEYESTISQNLLDSGVIVLGKANMDEFAMGSTNMTSYYGPSWSPYRKKTNPDMKLVPGGSSGGSASAVSANLCVCATGSDTGGSIRQPSAFCGLVGIKPTYGLCSRYGMIAFASSLDQAGPITKSVEDAAIMLKCMASYDEKDSTSEKVDIPNYTDFLGRSIKGMKIGIAKQYIEGLNSDNMRVFEDVKSWLLDAGCEFVDIDLKTTSYGLPSYYIIAPAEASSNLSRFDGVRYSHRSKEEFKNIDDLYYKSRSEGFGEEVKRRILTGTYVLSAGYFDAYYNKALKLQKMIRDDFRDNAFSKVDLVLTMTTPSVAFGREEANNMSPVEMYLNDIFTVNVNIAGLPGMSIPVGMSSKDCLPMGIQLIGNHFREDNIFSAAHIIEKSARFDELKKSMINIAL